MVRKTMPRWSIQVIGYSIVFLAGASVAFVPLLFHDNHRSSCFPIGTTASSSSTICRLSKINSARDINVNTDTSDTDTDTNIDANDNSRIIDASTLFQKGAHRPPILPAKEPLHSFFTTTLNTSATTNERNVVFSVLSWNILLPNSRKKNNWWNHKMYASWIPMIKREWPHRQALIRERLLTSDADIICIQEADGDSFKEDFGFLLNGNSNDNGNESLAGYQYCLHKKFRFRCVTFFKESMFALEQVAHKDRTLVVSLSLRQSSSVSSSTAATATKIDDTRILNVVNCHLSAGAAPERRLRQVYEALDQIRKWKAKVSLVVDKQYRANRPSPRNIQKAEAVLERHETAGTLVCGDFNSDGNTGVRRFLVEGSIDPEWREPQYPEVPLTSKRKEHTHTMVDATELAYAANVCDGDYGENYTTTDIEFDGFSSFGGGSRPATFVVPNLAALLLVPPNTTNSQAVPRTQFGQQIARGLADSLGLEDFCEYELDRAFDAVDLDKNDLIDEEEVQQLLESVYLATYGKQIENKKKAFFSDFRHQKLNTNPNPNSTVTITSAEITTHPSNSGSVSVGLSREQFTEKLIALQQELENGSTNSNSKSKKTSESGLQLARALADTLCIPLKGVSGENELKHAFESIDLDGNDLIDEEEIQKLLESVYVATYGSQIEEERREFFQGFHRSGGESTTTIDPPGVLLLLSRDQFAERLRALQQELEGGSDGVELVEIRTEADAQRMINRFSPLLRVALDLVFERFSGDGGKSLTEAEVSEFLIRTNGELGRGSTSRHTTDAFEKKVASSKQAVLNRYDWYGIFARELGEGKWWQVVYDLEICGAKLLTQGGSRKEVLGAGQQQHYQGWLDYVYFDSKQLVCTGVQEALTDAELSRIYDDGDTLPNEFFPSDHLPVAALFSWQ
mmetsp:Transcript_55862/g.62469  ORF Transcript_55862/g.62469 Transcript_55862/m.62469 type:complete len:910 (-) Transcript_55862:62-2791(-)